MSEDICYYCQEPIDTENDEWGSVSSTGDYSVKLFHTICWEDNAKVI